MKKKFETLNIIKSFEKLDFFMATESQNIDQIKHQHMYERTDG